MEFVQKFTPLDFQVKNFTPSILPNFNSFSKKKTQKMSENGEIYTAGKNFTLPPALTGWTNSTSASLWFCHLGVLELWNEPIDQKSTDQVRPQSFTLGENLTSGKWTFRRFLLSSLLGEGKLGWLLLYESSSLITMITIIVIMTKIITN